MEIVEIAGVRIPLDPSVMSAKIQDQLRAGRYEAAEARGLPAMIGLGERVVEAGAGIGFLTALAGRQGRAELIVAVEANPELIPVIERLHRLNGVTSVVRNAVVGLSRTAPALPFHLHNDLWASSLTPLKAKDLRGVVQVPVVLFAELIAEFAPTLLIIDVEVLRGLAAGGEPLDFAPLAGAPRVLVELKPKTLGPQAIAAILEAFASAGFERDADGDAGELALFRRRDTTFDPRGDVLIRPRAELLRQVFTPEDLRKAGDAWLALDPGGEARELGPTIRLGLPGDDFRIRYHTSETFVAGLDDAALVGRGVAVTQGGRMVAELSAHHSHDKFGAVARPGGIRFDPTAFRGGDFRVTAFAAPALLMAGPTDGSFGDWFVNFLPRLQMMRAVGLDCPVVISRNAHGYVGQTLAALGLGPDDIILHDPKAVSTFPRLYVPAWPMPHRRAAMARQFEGMAVTPAHRPRRGLVYLSRENVEARRLANEAEVRARFEQRGFVTVHPDRTPFAEMQAILAEAACVAGPYGSAFLNLAFQWDKPPSLVLAPHYYQGYLRETSLWLGGMGAPFGLLLGEGIEGVAYSDRAIDAPWRLDPALIDGAIDRMLDSAHPREGGDPGFLS